ncbi:MAG TPA: hypothetical protein VMH03_10510 [Terriglobales bacterium]|nr:hypothetical protein [Terriglobales bacterium]
MKADNKLVPVCRILIVGIFFLLGSSLCAQNLDESDGTRSWTSVTQPQFSGSSNPIRTTENHSQSGNRTLETQSLERMGADGRYQPYLIVERETVKVDSNTVKTVERSYASDPNGGRQLIQVTEGQSQTLGQGAIRTVRTTSSPDANGRLQVVQKEIEDTKQSSPNVQETKTSLFTADGNGGLSESVRTDRQETRSSDHTIQFQESKLVRDTNSNWQTSEVRQGVVKDDDQRRTKEQSVWQPDFNGKLAIVQRTVSTEIGTAEGKGQTTSETYSIDLAGTTRDGSLHPVERVTTLHQAGQDGQGSTLTRVEKPDPGSPTEGMRVTSQALEVVVRDSAGTARETRSVRAIDGSGDMSVVWVDMGSSDKPAAVQVNVVSTPGKPASAQPTTKASPAK